MFNSLASGRRLALRVVLLQLATGVIVGMAFLVRGPRDALAAAAGAALVALGTALLAARAFAGMGHGGMLLGRFLSGMALRWIIILGGLVALMGQWKLPPLAVIAGLGAACMVNLLVAFKSKG